jgi:hypothetical protein
MGPDRASCGKVLISPPGWASDRPPSKRAILGAKTQKRANGRISGSIPEEDIKSRRKRFRRIVAEAD